MATRGVPNTSHRPRRLRPNLTWQEYAACVDANPNIFFDPMRYAQALLVCRDCPVTQQCRLSRGGAEGVWGGRVYGRPPGRPRRKASA